MKEERKIIVKALIVALIVTIVPCMYLFYKNDSYIISKSLIFFIGNFIGIIAGYFTERTVGFLPMLERLQRFTVFLTIAILIFLFLLFFDLSAWMLAIGWGIGYFIGATMDLVNLYKK